MGQILIGTSSWPDPALVESGLFYPREATTPAARLQYYAQNFPIVEVDSSYYALPSEKNAALWVNRTPRDFTFDMKTFRLFTQHPTPLTALPKDLRSQVSPLEEGKKNLYIDDVPTEVVGELWKRFAQALLPLDSAGKLGVIMFQFPPWFHPLKENRDYILKCKENLPQYRLAVEFRTGTWLNDKNRDHTLQFLRENQLTFVCVDEPQGFKSSVPSVDEVTAPIAAVRFHGRNRETWEQKGLTVSERFRYLYSEEELKEWAPRVEHMADQAREVHVLFNNCHQDFAVRNGKQLQMMLS